MKHKRSKWNPLVPLVIIASVFVLGCQTPTASRGSYLDYQSDYSIINPDIANLIGPSIDLLTFSQQRAFSIIAGSVEFDWDLVDISLIALNAPVVERPEFWVELVNDTRRMPDLRAYYLQMLFLRHLRPGDSPAKFSTIQGTEGWFVAHETVETSRIASAIPIGGGYVRGIFVFAPDFSDPTALSPANVAVYFSTLDHFEVKDMAAIMSGEMEPPEDLFIVDISVSR